MALTLRKAMYSLSSSFCISDKWAGIGLSNAQICETNCEENKSRKHNAKRTAATTIMRWGTGRVESLNLFISKGPTCNTIHFECLYRLFIDGIGLAARGRLFSAVILHGSSYCVLSKHGTMQLYRWKRELSCNVGILDLDSVI